MPAASPTLVMRRRATRNTIETVDRDPMLANAEAACSARFAGFQIVRIKIRNRIPTGILLNEGTNETSDAGPLGDRRFHLVR